MSDNTDLIAELREQADRQQGYSWNAAKDAMRRAAAALAARDAACGHLSNELVAKVLRIAQHSERTDFPELFSDEWGALHAATFKAPE